MWDRELQVHGSATLASSLLEAGVVDTLRLVVAPTPLGSGRTLFGRNRVGTGFRLAEHHATTGDLMILEYEAVGLPAVADYAGASAVTR